MSPGPLGDTEQSPFSSGTLHFFSIILEETLRENKIRLPKKFVREYGETLSDSVFVKLPCGSKWKMELRKHENNIWLEKGWPDFAKHYSIKRGSMLLFRYEGNSEFHAVIFDTSTVEIDYPYIPVHSDKSDVDLELQAPKDVVVEDDVEILDDLLPCPKAREKSPLPCSQAHKSLRTSHGLDFGAKLERPLTDNERARILEKVPFECEKPFFKALMRPTHVGSKAEQFRVPSDFAMRYMKNLEGDVVLYVPSVGSWFVEFRMRPSRSESCVARLCKGWREFSNGNSLEVGDVCIFKLLDGAKTSFEVFIVRFAEYEYTQWSQHPLTSIERVPFVSENPFFKVYMQPTYVGSKAEHLDVPLDFAMSYIKNEGDVILLGPNGNYWHAQFKMNPLKCGNRLARLCDGWQEFANGNNLEVGDVCIFELLDVDGNKTSFKVSIDRFAECASLQRSLGVDNATSARKSKGDARVKIEID
ncbi:B3 DNA binding domain containing protein [Parasponia andersonii]|uniref:B3 DNA binding domain containing protein n=1 Tax=Parasponia andersonii TaxID=3476 RepID=A0A2P5BZ41_PARAD|nr:B3 DNA binding domain containing protein [Parasponia andersonii]